MGRLVVDEYVRLAEAAFREPPSADGDTPSLLENLLSVPPEAWDWVPPRGARTIRDLVTHVGASKLLYDDHAFRSATLSWANPGEWMPSRKAPAAEVVAWLERCHAGWAESIAALEDDSELARARRTPAGELQPTARLISGLTHHDAYHAGEINHIRALFMENDAWAWE